MNIISASKETFKVGDIIIWGEYLTRRPNNSVQEGPFEVTEVKAADSVHVMHRQLLRIKPVNGELIDAQGYLGEYSWFSGAWFTLKDKTRDNESKWRHIEL